MMGELFGFQKNLDINIYGISKYSEVSHGQLPKGNGSLKNYTY